MARRVFLLLVLGASLAFAQEVGPRAVVRGFLADMEKAVDGDEDALRQAVARLDLSDVPAGDRERLGATAAGDLYNAFLRVDRAVFRGLSMAESADRYGFDTPYGRVELVKGADGRWRFAPETVDGAREFAEAAKSDPVRGGAKEYVSATRVLRDWVPDWLRGEIFLLQNWQWAGLFGLILFGLIAGAMGRVAAFGIARRVARRRGVELAKGKKIGRPFGLIATAVLWMLGLPFLDLAGGAYSALMLAARFVLMAGVVWSLCQIVDWIAEVLENVVKRTDTRIDDILVPMVRKALKVFVIALGIVWIADNMGMNVASLVAGLGIGGLALALASRDTVENFFGAVAILADHPFQVGDWIKMGTIEGTVESVGFRSTRVRTFYNSLISFPNSMLIRTEVDNLGARRYRRFKATVGITYDTPPDKVEAFVEGIRELVRRHPYTRKDYFHVYLNGFGPSSLDVLLYVFFDCPDWGTELRERQRLLVDILRLAQQLGVEFAFPTRTLHMIQSGMPEHGEPAEIADAHRAGRKTARGIVETFTGKKRPPPVDADTTEPDDAAES